MTCWSCLKSALAPSQLFEVATAMYEGDFHYNYDSFTYNLCQVRIHVFLLRRFITHWCPLREDKIWHCILESCNTAGNKHYFLVLVWAYYLFIVIVQGLLRPNRSIIPCYISHQCFWKACYWSGFFLWLWSSAANNCSNVTISHILY